MDGEGDIDSVAHIQGWFSAHCEMNRPLQPGPYFVLFGPFLCLLCQGQDKGEASLLPRIKKVREHSLSSLFK